MAKGYNATKYPFVFRRIIKSKAEVQITEIVSNLRKKNRRFLSSPTNKVFIYTIQLWYALKSVLQIIDCINL